MDIITNESPYLLRAMYEWISDNNMPPMITVNATHPDLIAPIEYAVDGILTFNISMASTKDLVMLNDFIEFGSTFNGNHVQCHVPIDAITQIRSAHNGMGMSFAPPDKDIKTPPKSPSHITPPKSPPKLRLV